MWKLAALAMIAVGCEAGSKPEAQQPKDQKNEAPAAAVGAAPPPTKSAEKPEQVALNSGDPCEGGESIEKGGPGGAPASGGGIGTLGGKGTGGRGIGAGASKSGPGRSPTISTGQATVSGNTDKDTLARIIRAHAGAMRACFLKQLTAQPDLAGKIVVKFTIGKDGHVAKAEVTSGLQSDVDACVVAVFQKLEFPAQDSEVTVSFPVVFASK
jgi:outer membrane biosynthesis protein TonB